ncbi:MAG: hypothetical protein Q9168_004286 [Polycauliona sp. 1 TL-2023]
MLRLTVCLILAFSSLSVLALPTDGPLAPFSIKPYTGTLDFTPRDIGDLVKRAQNLPNNWEFVFASQPAIVEPIHLSAKAIIALYTAAINHASQKPAPADHDASFKDPNSPFVLIINGDPAQGKLLDWPTIVEFSKRMKENADLGKPLLIEGWLLNRKTNEQMYLKLGFQRGRETMSFGWSATDIALLVQLAYKTTQGAKAACGEYDELTRETLSLHTILNRLHLEIEKPESSIGRHASYGWELQSIATGCDEVLNQLDKILVKYNALSQQERSARRLWKKIRFASGVVADVAELRSRITSYTSAISLFLNLVFAGTIGAVESKMDQTGGDLRDIKAAVNHITAHFLAAERREDSVLTAYTNDDRSAWRELRRGLVKAGFRDSLVRKHMDTIMAYVKELSDKGVLDEVNTQEVNVPTDSNQESGGSKESLDMQKKPRPPFTTPFSAVEGAFASTSEDEDNDKHPPELEQGQSSPTQV